MQRPELQRVGGSQTPVVIIDDFTGQVDALRAEAVRLAPFPKPKDGYYPGLRREIGAADGAAYAMVVQAVRSVAPFIGQTFDCNRLELAQASFSMVTLRPEALQPGQRAPHFDAADPRYLALLLYLSEGSGTAFYRHRKTGVERVTTINQADYVATARAEHQASPRPGYILGSDDFYEQTGMVEAKLDRLAIYPGAMLHSGVISPGLDLSPDPAKGRLTLNIFLQGR